MNSLLEHDFHDCTIIDGQIVVEKGEIFVSLEIKSDNFLLNDIPLKFSTKDLLIMLQYAKAKHIEMKQKKGETMSNQPLDRGRIVYAADSYQSNEVDASGQPKTKYRYATLGRATKWQGDNGGEQVELELDSIPLKAESPLKLKIFWDSQSSQNAQQQQYQQQGGFNQQSPQGQMPPHVANAQGGWQNNQ